MIKVFEAFAGIGTQRMALRNIGVEHEVVAISEIDKYAIASYEAIHGPVNNLGDISKVKSEEIPDHDLFTYSFPCTDISAAGKRKGFHKGSGTRSSLLWECERIIKDKRPKYLLMENVKALNFKTNKPYFEEWLNILKDYGYTNYSFVLNAKDYSVPQNRERLFCVSIHEEENSFTTPSPIPLEYSLLDYLEESTEELNPLAPSYLKRMSFEKVKDAPKEKVNKILRVETLIETDWYKADHRVFHANGIAPTIITHNNIVVLYPSKEDTKFSHPFLDGYDIRRLTVKEAWRLMGIRDDDFEKAKRVVSNTQLYKQAGNAIVVQVLEAIFKEMFTGDSSD